MDISGFKAIFESMTPEERQEKIKALTEINKLKQYCWGKGFIKIEKISRVLRYFN